MKIIEIIGTNKISHAKTGGEKYACELISHLDKLDNLDIHTISISDILRKNNLARVIFFSDRIKLYVISHLVQMIIGKIIARKIEKEDIAEIDLVVSQHETPICGILAIELGKMYKVPVIIKHQLPLTLGTPHIRYDSLICAIFGLQRFMLKTQSILKKSPILLGLGIQDIIQIFLLKKYYNFIDNNAINVTVSKGLSIVLKKFFNADVVAISPLVAIVQSKIKIRPNYRFRITFFTRISYSKGANIVPFIFDELRRICKEFNPIFTVMGNINDKSVYELKTIAEELDLPIETYFNVSQGKKLLILRESLCVVHPSLHDATPISVLESLSSGTPVVMWDLPFGLEFDTKAVEKARFHDIHDFAIKTIEQIHQFEKLSDEAVNFASKYNWDNVIKNEIELYKNTCSKYK